VEDRAYTDDLLLQIMQRHHSNIKLVHVPPDMPEDNYNVLFQTMRQSDIFVLATQNADRDLQQAKLVQYLLSSGRRLLVIALQNPYDLQAFPQLGTYLCTYEYSRPAIEAAIRVMFGETLAKGKLPVNIPSL
jgi:beta-N-acetylhexosaminidase